MNKKTKYEDATMLLSLFILIMSTLLLVILWTVKTSAFETGLTKPPVGKIIDLKTNDRVPFYGKLLNEPAFAFYANLADENFLLKGSLESCDHENLSNKSDIVSMKTVVAFILGGLVVYSSR